MSNIISNKLFNYLVIDSEEPQTVRCQVFVGTFCNYKCRFCYYKDKTRVSNVSEDVYKQMDFIKSFGIIDVELTGGEPTIDPEFFNYLSYSKKLFRHVSLITNGQKMSDKDFSRKCFDFGLREVLFSLHGYDKESHESITGIKNSWDNIIKAIDIAKEIGLIVRINCTVCNINYKNLDRLALRLKEINPKGVNFIPLNYWDGGDNSGVEIPYCDMAPYIKQAIDIIKGHTKYINVRYMPYCDMVGYEEFVCNWHQHSYDYWDWNNSFKKLPNLEYRKVREYVDEVREYIYGKKIECFSCKYRAICDGVEKKIIDTNKLTPTLGDLITDPLFFRKEYCTLEEYNNVISSKN